MMNRREPTETKETRGLVRTREWVCCRIFVWPFYLFFPLFPLLRIRICSYNETGTRGTERNLTGKFKRRE
jgi:hypothetical protein